MKTPLSLRGEDTEGIRTLEKPNAAARNAEVRKGTGAARFRTVNNAPGNARADRASSVWRPPALANAKSYC
jgi:hypothetical protein